MTAIFFKSEALGRVVYLSDIEALEYQELSKLRAELTVDIESMETRMYRQRDEASSEWLCSISYKLSVCKQFLNLCNKFLDQKDKQNFVNLVFDSVEEVCGKDAAESCWVMAHKKLRTTTNSIS